MFEKINSLQPFFNVSGYEDEMMEAFIAILGKNGNISRDAMGNVHCFIAGTGKNRKKILVSTSVDVPGFLCLCNDGHSSSLAPTGALNVNEIKGKKISSSSKINCCIPKNLDNIDTISIRKAGLPIGESLRFVTEFSESKNSLSGFYVGKYVLIQILLDLAANQNYHDIIFSFCAQGETNAKSEANAVHLWKPDIALLLSRIDSAQFDLNEESPCIVKKDGNAFSNTELINFSENLKLKTIPIVTTKPISKLHHIFVSNGETKGISVALPVKNIGTFQETVSKTAYKRMQQFLKSFIQKI